MARARGIAWLSLFAGLLACSDDGVAPQASGGSTSGDAADSADPGAAGSESGNEDDPATTGADDGSTGAVPPSDPYSDLDLWLCHPDKDPSDDECLRHDLSATQILPDGSTQIVEHTIAVDPTYDCFYVYPTVDIRLTPGQTENFDDISQELDPLLNQAARFSGQCRLFAPLYHQVTIGTFGTEEAPALLDAAYQDVANAFAVYRAQHLGDRPLVLIGHSQGTFMLTRLIQEEIETDPALLDQLVVAVMLGGSINVPTGEDVGGTFSAVPRCTTADQTGCVLALRSYAAEFPPGPSDQPGAPRGHHELCTDPTALLGHERLSGTYLPTFANQPAVFPITDFGRRFDTPFVLLSDLYRAECRTDRAGQDYLAILVDPAEGDVRQNSIDFEHPLYDPGFLGLHVLDFNFPQQELLTLVEQKAAALEASR